MKTLVSAFALGVTYLAAATVSFGQTVPDVRSAPQTAQTSASTAQNPATGGEASQAALKISSGPVGPRSASGPKSDLSDFNNEIYYKNKLELSFDGSYLPFNVPFIFDPIAGAPFSRPKKQITNYVLLPLIFSLRWQLYDVRGPSLLRGNTEYVFGLSYMPIIQGPESFYAAIVTGLRYNFVQRNWPVVPYFDARGGFGWTDAKEPREYRLHQSGVGQGQDFTFNFILGTGLEYNFNRAYSISAGVSYLHISNMYLSEPRYPNHGINVVGPNVGFNFLLECPGWVCRKG